MNFKDLIEKGIKHKESRQTNLALDLYKQALDIAETDDERANAWMHILHIHTDKMLATLIEIAEVFNISVSDLQDSKTKEPFEWVFGTNRFKQGSNEPDVGDYFRPNKESLFR